LSNTNFKGGIFDESETRKFGVRAVKIVKVRNDIKWIKKCRIAGKFVDQFGEQMESFCKEAANC
jgi:hypothetical protein